jgi:hypothetical protein
MYAITDKLMLEDGTYRVSLEGGQLVPAMERGTGYWVASTNLVAPTPEHVGRCVRLLVEDHDADYIGVWTSSIGRTFVDVTTHFEDLEVAMRIAKYWEQDAIWDCANECLIDVD